VASGDPFARWQGQLQRVLGPHAAFQTAVSFARTGNKWGDPHPRRPGARGTGP